MPAPRSREIAFEKCRGGHDCLGVLVKPRPAVAVRNCVKRW
jgi:hypothetical protein